MEETPTPQEQSIGTKLRLFFIDTAQSLLVGIGIFLVINFLLFRPFQVSGNSMYSTYKDKEYILTNLISLRFHDPSRGDVVVFQSPVEPNRDLIKRVIGIPGDRISVHGGYVYVNGEKVNESKYLDEGIKTYGGAFIEEGEEKIVPPGYYAVMGDNRPDSSDFRQWGFISRKNIIGISQLVYWPPSHLRVIENPFK